MSKYVMGGETEYSAVVLLSDGVRQDSSDTVEAFIGGAREIFKYLSTEIGASLFLENGGRLYPDCGGVIEFACAETTDPWASARYMLAGDECLYRIGEHVRNTSPGVRDVLVFKGNTGYDVGVAGTTWGAHESYMSSGLSEMVRDFLLPHLASRIVLTGSGGFDSLSYGIDFMISPRVAHLERETSAHSTCARGIFHLKNETLARRSSRLHVLCGDGLQSERSNVLRFGTTALALRVAEHYTGVPPVKLRNTLEAMKRFARDPLLRSWAYTHSDRHVRALDIQRLYLEIIEARVGEPYMPAWAGELCLLWRDTLDALEDQGIQGAALSLDYGIKHLVYQDQARQAGIAWNRVPQWSHVLKQIGAAIIVGDRSGRTTVNLAPVLSGSSEACSIRARLQPFMDREELSWGQLEDVVQLRLRLFKAEKQYGQVGPESLFAQLEKSGLLRHTVPGVRPITPAVTSAPEDTRAALRGRWIRELHGKNAAHADWMRIQNTRDRKFLDLADPLCIRADWQDYPEPPAPPPPDIESRVERDLARRLAELHAAREAPRFVEDGGNTFSVGDVVQLGRHTPVNGNYNWCEDMDQYVGAVTHIIGFIGRDTAGCMVARVEADNHRYAWRIRDMSAVSSRAAEQGVGT